MMPNTRAIRVELKGGEMKQGDRLYFVPSERRGDPRYVTVTKVGRRWAELDNRNRVDINTMQVAGGAYGSLGRCYLTEAEYTEASDLDQAWTNFWRDIYRHNRPPQGVTTACIQEVRTLLGLAESNG